MDIIKEFEKIRDFPYHIPIFIGDKDYCCTGKCIKLKSILEKYGYSVKYKVCSFSWRNLNINESLYNIKHEDLSTHVWLQININGKWINIDPTWDTKIKNIFKIESWDGKNSINIAVKPIEIFDDEKSKKIMENENIDDIKKDLDINGKFYKSFNEWLEKVREV